jgi:very-short-patch-repair endonuclease
MPVSGRVLRAAAVPDHQLTRAMAALLHVGRDAAIGGASAAAFWGLPGFRIEPVEVLRGRGGTTSANGLCRVHTSTAFDDGHVSEVDGMYVTSPVRTVFDLSASLHPLRTARLLDSCHNRGLVTWPSVHRLVSELGKRGRRGTALMRALAAERPEGFRPPESNLEARVNEILIRDGQRPFTPQIDLGDDDWIGRVDLVDRVDRIALEVQSGLFHGNLTDRRRDDARMGRLRAAGWTVVEVDDFEVWHRPHQLVQRVRAARRDSRRVRFAAA